MKFRSGHSTTWIFLSTFQDRSISLEQGENQQKTQPGYMWHQFRRLNPSNRGGRQALAPLRHSHSSEVDALVFFVGLLFYFMKN